MVRYIVSMLALWLVQCSMLNISMLDGMVKMNTASLQDQLLDTGYVSLFMSMDEADLNQIWSAPDARTNLAALVLDENAEPEARFLAAEVLFVKDSRYPPDKAKTTLASVYAAALSRNYTKMANPWGLPDDLDGAAGQHFVALGDAAVPKLTELLDNTTSVRYGGSSEATYGNSYQYRVKDLAAFYLSKIRGIAYTVHESPQERDAEIEKLRAKL
jgi:hypothetical protein